jgi:hypothetical protein
VLKWRRWKVAYPEVHGLELPDPTSMYDPEELETRRLRNLAEEEIADQEARRRREEPTVPDEGEYIARCMRLWGDNTEAQLENKSKKRVYDCISDASTQDGDSVGEPDSPTGKENANQEADNLDQDNQDKPTQSDCMSVDYSPYTAEDPEERAGATPVPPGGDDEWGNQSGGSNPSPVQNREHRWLIRWMAGLDEESLATDPEPVDLADMPEDLEDATAEQLEALLPTPPAIPTREELRGRLTAMAECFALCWKYASIRYGPGTARGDGKNNRRLRERATQGLRGLRQVPRVLSRHLREKSRREKLRTLREDNSRHYMEWLNEEYPWEVRPRLPEECLYAPHFALPK